VRSRPPPNSVKDVWANNEIAAKVRIAAQPTPAVVNQRGSKSARVAQETLRTKRAEGNLGLTDQLDTTEAALTDCPLAAHALHELLSARAALTLDGERPNAIALGDRLASFWLHKPACS
jgi:hypothetical protein